MIVYTLRAAAQSPSPLWGGVRGGGNPGLNEGENRGSSNHMTNLMSERARWMRKSKTDSERKLWRKLRQLNAIGFHFRQQAPIGPYIADFADLSAKLVIEVDGFQHGETGVAAADAVRTRCLRSQGFRVLRFWNIDVLRGIDGVMTTILMELGILTGTAERQILSPPRGGVHE